MKPTRQIKLNKLNQEIALGIRCAQCKKKPEDGLGWLWLTCHAEGNPKIQIKLPFNVCPSCGNVFISPKDAQAFGEQIKVGKNKRIIPATSVPSRIIIPK
jgi:hypothetical protein